MKTKRRRITKNWCEHYQGWKQAKEIHRWEFHGDYIIFDACDIDSVYDVDGRISCRHCADIFACYNSCLVRLHVHGTVRTPAMVGCASVFVSNFLGNVSANFQFKRSGYSVRVAGCSERVQLARRTTAYHVGTGSTSSLVSVAFKIRVVKFCWFLAADVPFSSANYVSYRSSSPSHSIQCFIMLRHQLTCNRHDGSEFCMFDVKDFFFLVSRCSVCVASSTYRQIFNPAFM